MNSGSPPDLRQIFLSGFAPKRLKENRCQSYDIYVFCLNPDTPPYKSAATNACKEAGKSGKFIAQTLRYVLDSRCGYPNIRITCE
jgi:hypothetical protein